MVMFRDQKELADYLGRIHLDYSEYAAELWGNGARSEKQLADASIELLQSAGLKSFAAAIIKETAGVHA
jgi:hypothetical protein